jgi:hypothetical protein
METTMSTAKQNQFFQHSTLTMDDLDFYAKPFTDLLHGAMRLAGGSITDGEAARIMQQSAKRYAAMNATLARKYDAEDATRTEKDKAA